MHHIGPPDAYRDRHRLEKPAFPTVGSVAVDLGLITILQTVDVNFQPILMAKASWGELVIPRETSSDQRFAWVSAADRLMERASAQVIEWVRTQGKLVPSNPPTDRGVACSEPLVEEIRQLRLEVAACRKAIEGAFEKKRQAEESGPTA